MGYRIAFGTSYRFESSPAMDKRQLIEAIQTLNENAEGRFLEQFDAQDLAEYLKRLHEASTRNLHLKTWAKPSKREYRMVS